MTGGGTGRDAPPGGGGGGSGEGGFAGATLVTSVEFALPPTGMHLTPAFAIEEEDGGGFSAFLPSSSAINDM